MTNNLVFIGDRPAQMAALVLDCAVTYTADRADPFVVQRLVERYVDSLDSVVPISQRRRRIVLSTGLAWSPKYDGMAARQVNYLGSAHPSGPLRSFTPRVYVLPVSSAHILGHSLNHKLEQMCEGTPSRRGTSLFLGGRHPLWSFSGSVGDASSPTPVEILSLSEVLKNLIKLDP